MEKFELISKLKKIMQLYKDGALGGEKMPEDANPNFNKGSEENYIYFTLPMALNYQRNSYNLWEAALKTYTDAKTQNVFDLNYASKTNENILRQKLLKYKLALQPNKHTEIWQKLSLTFQRDFGGSVKNFLKFCNFDIMKIKEYISNHKKDFPYLSGSKILNYWLYVLSQYTDAKFLNRQEITIAPDTHILQSSVKLGVISNEELNKNNIREITSERWKNILKGSGIQPIDLHTPFWLWSRNGFKVEV